jgi:hypothetical protein
MRIFVLTLVALILVGTIPGLIGLVMGSNGTLNPPHSDYAVDTSFPPNGLYEQLIVNVSVDVTVAGMFFFMVDLYDNSGSNWIDGQFNMPNLPLGLQNVTFSFTGFTIRSSGYDGPYQASIIMLDDMGMLLDTGVHMTGPYLAMEFEGAPGSFKQPHSDRGLDTNNDTLYDFLIISANITTNASDSYSIQCDLWDATGMFFIDFSGNGSFLPVGNHTMDLSFTGYLIRASGIDGPYRVEMYLYDSMWNLMDNDTYFTGPYMATNFSNPPVQFEPPHGDYGLDTNGNMLYEYLVVNASVNVTGDGTYMIFGSAPFGFSQVNTFLTIGLHIVELKFYGYDIYQFGIDGPYTIDLEVRDEMFNLLDSDIHTTVAYLYTDFEPNPPVMFSPPHWDYGLDTDGDTDFNWLMINANISVDAPGQYRVYADLFDITGITWIDTQSNSTWLNIGNHTVDVAFYGPTILLSGIDGPYQVELYLEDENGWPLDIDTHITNAYLATDFDQRPAFFNPPHSDYGLDTSFPPDGIFEFLVVNASVMVNDPGLYLVQALLLDPFMMPLAMIQQAANLSVGPGNVTLQFSGIDINRNGVDGSFAVVMDLLVFGPMGPPISIDNDFHFTNFYNYVDFVSLPVSPLWGYVYDGRTGAPIFMSEVLAVNYSYGWMMRLQTDPSGYFEFQAFDGDFVVVMDDPALQAELSPVTVLGSTEVTRTLDLPPPGEMNTDLTFSDWDNAVANTMGFMADDNQSIRFMIDYVYGNKNAYLDQSEADWFISMMGGGFQPNLTSTMDMLYVDGIHYNLVPGTDFFNFDMTGPVASTSPFTMSVGGDYTSNSTIPVAATHLMELNNTYDMVDELSMFSGQAPAGWNLQFYDPVANVTVTGLGTPNFVADPLMDPDPMDLIDWVWVNLTFGQGPLDTFPPQTLSVTINGQAAPSYGMSALPPVLFINATIDDTLTGNVPIGGANFTEGPQNWVLSWPMTASDGAFDTPVEDATGTISSPPLGMTLYCVYGWDIALNYNTTDACASLTILDDIGPQITNVMIDGAPTQTYSLSTAPLTATLTATLDETTTGTADIGGANYTTPMIDSWPGTPMNPSDGAFDGMIEGATIVILVPNIAGTYDYFVHGWDAVLYASVSGPAQITIVDDLAPTVSNVLLNGMPSISVMPGTMVTVDALVDDTGGRGDNLIAGANFTVGAAFWPGQWMLAADGAFDETSEIATEVIDTTGWVDNVYDICVYGWDDVPNRGTTDVCAQLTISSVDTEPPFVLNALVNSLPSVTVSPGTSIDLTATIDDAPALGSDILGANYTIDGDWLTSQPMSATDGTFDSPTEGVQATIDTTGWADAVYQVCVHGSDVTPNDNISMTACAQVTIVTPDTTPPDVINVLLDGSASLTVAPGAAVIISATIDDSATGNGIIGGANYTISMTWPGSMMFPTDGAFDTDTEDVNLTIDTTGWADGTYQICVHGWDDVPNGHDAFDACAQLTIQSIPPDTTPPNISNVQIDPDPAGPGEDVRISADVYDDVALSEVRIEVRDPSDSAITNVTMSYDSANDEYYLTDPYTTEGSYSFTIWATDTSGNLASETGSFEIVEQDPPIIDVTVSNENPAVGDIITFEADVTDDSDLDDVRITVLDPEGTTVVNNQRMTLDNGVYVYEYEFGTAGDYTYTITANDEHGNSDDVSGTITASEVVGSFFDQYWWLILVIVIIVVVLLIVLMLMRKPKAEEFAPDPESAAPPAEEPVVEPPEEESFDEPPEESDELPTEEEAEEPPPPDDMAEDEALDELE